MSDLTAFADYPHAIVSTGSPESQAFALFVAGGLNFTATGAWPAANLALYMPILIGAPIIAVKMLWKNGATVGTNHVDVGIYDAQGNQIVHIGSTLTSGVSVAQSVDITDTTLLPGLYYLAMACDGTTDTFSRWNMAAPLARTVGGYEQTTAFTLPSTATFTGSTRAYLPYVALTSQVTI